MKSILITALIAICNLAFSQEYLDKIAQTACNCLENIDNETTSENHSSEVGLCIINAAQAYEKKIKKDYGFEIENFDSQGKKFAIVIAGKMMTQCPNIIISEMDESKKSKNSNGYYLKEDFVKNERGWIEEKTDFHHLEIHSGYYHISSIDTNSSKSSSASRDRSYLYKLPDNYSIICEIEILDSKLDTAFCGILLDGATTQIEFQIPETGKIKVETYDYNTKKNGYYEMENPDINTKTKNIKIEIKISGWSFDLNVNGEYIGGGLMESKTWDSIRPFAGKSTSIKIDYLYIK